MNETYTPGYNSKAMEFMAERSAEDQARFVLPLLKPGQRLLDIGCGPGTITMGLARAVAPGEVVAVDMEPTQIAAARERFHAAGMPVPEFHRASIYELPFPSEHFDVVFSHAVFEHLQEQGKALIEIKRVLRPGGIVALRSPDWGAFLLHPASPEVVQGVEYFKRIQTANGGKVNIGRELKRLALEAGFKQARWTASYDYTEHAGTLAEFVASQIERSLESNYPARLGLNAEEVRPLPGAMRRFIREVGAVFAAAWGEVVAVK